MGNILGLGAILLLIVIIGVIIWKGKDLLKMQAMQGSFFKQVKFLFSSPQKAQNVVLLSETGAISKEILPMDTGFASSPATRRTWLVLHPLKHLIYKDGVQYQDDPVLLISERNYLPLDPNTILKPKDKERLASLKDIARLKHAEARSLAGKTSGSDTLANTIIYGSFIMIGVFGIIGLVLRKWG
jgi:hypothetical protein